MKSIQDLWKPIQHLPQAKRAKLESEFHLVLNISNARIRNTQPQYAEQLEKTEKKVWYEFGQLCEEYGVSMEPFYAHRRNSERLWEALKQPGGVREAMELMGAAPGRSKSERHMALWLVAIAVAVAIVGILASLHF